MDNDIVKMKTPDGVILNVNSSCVPVFKKAGYTVIESEAEEKPDEEENPAEEERLAEEENPAEEEKPVEEEKPAEKKRKASK